MVTYPKLKLTRLSVCTQILMTSLIYVFSVARRMQQSMLVFTVEMESQHQRDLSTYKEFLEEFCRNHNGPLEQSDALPFRLTTCYLTEAELEGECLDWTLQYLYLK